MEEENKTQEQTYWIKRHPIWTGIIGFFVLFFIIGHFVEDDSSTKITSDVVNKSKEIENNTSTQNNFIGNDSSNKTNSDVVNKSKEIENNTQTQDDIQNDSQIDNHSIISNNTGTFKVASWNLQIFGDTKASKPELMNFYASVIDDYNIVFIQEIRDADGSAFADLCSLVPDYDCRISSRAGRSTSKEQYGVVYKKGIEIKNWEDYNPDAQDRWERPPLKVTFNINGYELTAYNIHTKPDAANQEIRYLEDVVEDKGNVIVLGDLNADCDYYKTPPVDFQSWNWVIGDNKDTTSSSTDCAYDRIISNDDAYREYSNYGIYSEGITSNVSDHYLVWVELKK